jgi:hypothetical protein
VLAAVKLTPAAVAIWHAVHGPENGKNNVSVSFSNFVLNLIVSEQGKTTWTGSAHLGAIALWVAGVPLLLWLVWATMSRTPAPPADETRERL